MSLFLPSARSEYDSFNERRSAIYLPDGLATKLVRVCGAAAGLESSEPNSPIHSDLDDLWSGILASSVSSVDSFRAEEVIRRFAERYGLVHRLSGSNLDWLNEVGNLKTPSGDLYKDLLIAAFGTPSDGTVYKNENCNYTPRTGFSSPNFDEEVDDPPEWSPQISRFSPPPDLPEINTDYEAPRFYYNRPHTPQVIRVDLSQKNHYDFWEIPNLMKKPSLFPPTLHNVKNWISWRRLHGRR